MKIKKFKNQWSMGLIIFGIMLIAFYLLKIINPEFVIELSEIDRVVELGEYVDSHKWAYYLFFFIISFAGGYFYVCACCRKKSLKFRDVCILAIEVILLFVVEKYLMQYYVYINWFCMLIMPTIICRLDGRTDIKYLYSTVSCLTIHSIAQLISLEIRNISLMISFPNSATFTVLTIDAFIWLVLLYNFYNFKEDYNNG